ncbi:MAG: DegQ family serine endoprotease [Nitrospirae bacterium]|nr:DegQ family serine endoprotease [Nitrospirota bacterium]
MAKKSRFFNIKTIFLIMSIITIMSPISDFTFNSYVHATETGIPSKTIDILSKTNEAIAAIAAVVKPSVVNISSTKIIRSKSNNSLFPDDPLFRKFFDDSFRFFERPRQFKQSSLGSGVIVDQSGYILTNNHVIKDAEEIKIKLFDKREFTGKVIGTDPKTDLAVIKIDATDLPAIKFGNSDNLKVGETVLAIGNPFGLNETVTSGIISAIGRANVGIADYEDFIQTDAPINPGNSGGALVNIKGELVGINTAIFSTTGGYQGIGFAIPSNMAKAVMQDLIQKGKVVRGWLGVTIQSLTPDLSEQFGIKDEKGVLVGDVIENSPAKQAGIERGDVIIGFNGKKVDDVTQLKNLVANTQPGKKVAVELIREGNRKTLMVTISELPSEITTVKESYDNLLKNVSVQELSPKLKKRLNIPERINGVIITDIEDDSPAKGHLERGDIIIEINKVPINSLKDYESVVSKIQANEEILILISRQNSTFFVLLSER